MPRLAALFLLLWLPTACLQTGEPEPADPALWQITASNGRTGWLFGTVHALKRPAKWDTPAVAAAMDEAGAVMVEIAYVDDPAAIAGVFERLAAGQDLPPLSDRVDPARRAVLRQALERTGLSDKQFGQIETWAAALTLAQAAAANLDPRHGIDRAVLAAAGEKPIIELEGTEAQLGLFDALPLEEQADLLEAIAAEAALPPDEGTDLAQAWRNGDMAAIAHETQRGLLADKELRAALFTGRNQAWTAQIAAAVERGRKPFVAVGAAHLAGPDGLPAMLRAKGFAVRRIR